MRKDEATHREVNHTFANLKRDDCNPYLANESYHKQVTDVGGGAPKKKEG